MRQFANEAMMFTFNLDQITAVAEEFLRECSGKKIFTFQGELGAGKTTFIKALCEELGVKDVMSSPTFSIVNEYHDANGKSIYHMDLYRIKSMEEAMNAGVEEYLYSGNYVFIEWPEVVEEMLPEETVNVQLMVQGEERILVVKR